MGLAGKGAARQGSGMIDKLEMFIALAKERHFGRAAEACGVTHGCAHLRLEVRTDNEPAIGLYESVGFVKMGVRKRYYRISGADAYTMRRDAGVSSESGGADVRSNQVT